MIRVKEFKKDGCVLDLSDAPDVEKIVYVQLPNADECEICDADECEICDDDDEEEGEEYDPTGEGFKPSKIIINNISRWSNI